MMRPLFRLSRIFPLLALASALAAPPLAPAFAVESAWTPIVPPGWDKVTMPDLISTGDFGFRAWQVDGYMEAAGDFDGDGRRDAAEVYINRHTGNHAVFITLNARAVARVYKVIEAPANLMARISISRALPGEYVNACAKGFGDGKTCTPAIFRVKHDGLAYFAFETAAKMVYWDGRSFVEEFVSDE